MPQHPHTWAKNARFKLAFALGGCCVQCGTAKDLEFDCIEPQGHRHHTLGFVKRTTFYRRQHKEGNLQLLCAKCHRKKTKADLVKIQEMEENEPF